eukprot:7700882-Lingulodinium_polyedra.AAC.1
MRGIVQVTCPLLLPDVGRLAEGEQDVGAPIPCMPRPRQTGRPAAVGERPAAWRPCALVCL